jgi:hypothetical protein
VKAFQQKKSEKNEKKTLTPALNSEKVHTHGQQNIKL